MKGTRPFVHSDSFIFLVPVESDESTAVESVSSASSCERAWKKSANCFLLVFVCSLIRVCSSLRELISSSRVAIRRSVVLRAGWAAISFRRESYSSLFLLSFCSSFSSSFSASMLAFTSSMDAATVVVREGVSIPTGIKEKRIRKEEQKKILLFN